MTLRSMDPLSDGRRSNNPVGTSNRFVPSVSVVPDSHRLIEIHRRGADKGRDEDVVGPTVEVLGRIHLLENPGLQHGHPVTHCHGLDLVVGHVDCRDTQAALKGGNLGTHLDTQLGIEVRQGFVHQERRRLADDGAAHGDPLPLAPGQVAGLPVEIVVSTPGSPPPPRPAC